MPTYYPNKYNVQMHGGPNGYRGKRAIVRLKKDTTAVAYIYYLNITNNCINIDSGNIINTIHGLSDY